MKNVYGKELDNFTRLTRHYQDWEVESAKQNKDYITTDYFCPRRDISYDDCLNKLGSVEDIEEKINIPFSKIASLKKDDKVYVLYGTQLYEGLVSSINYDELFITILVGKTFIDYMLFHQYGKNRHTPSHCWSGAWALTRKELE